MNLASNDSNLLNQYKGNTSIVGSNVNSGTSGDINITSKGNTSITASKDTYMQNSSSEGWNSSVTLASSNSGGAGAAIDNIVNAASLALGAGISRSKSSATSTIYNNSTLTSTGGDIKINSIGTTSTGSQVAGDTTISGANILALNTTINTGGNLLVESKQNESKSKSRGYGFSLGGSAGVSGGGSGNIGFNRSSSNNDRLWVDNQTTILGTNSVNINTANKTNLIGSVIANVNNANLTSNKAAWIDGGNLTINTGSLIYSNLNDHNYADSSTFGLSTSIGIGQGRSANNTTGQGTANSNNPNQQDSFYPNGSTTLTLQNSSTKKEGITRATIGNGNITTGATLAFDANGDLTSSNGGVVNDQTILKNLNRDITKSQETTLDQITGALDVNVTIDNM